MYAIQRFDVNFDLALDNFVFGTFLSVIFLIIFIKLLNFVSIEFSKQQFYICQVK